MTTVKDKKISEDVALQEFDRFVDAMDLDFDPRYMDEDETKSFGKNKARLVKAMTDGSLMVNNDGELVYTPQKEKDPKPITFHERTGASLMATNGVRKGDDATKMYRMIADMTEESPKRFANLKGIDIKISEIIFGFLMD